MAEKDLKPSQDLEESLKEALTEPIVRDFMAVERTMMANERTFLAYVRTALGLFIGGLSFVHFFDNSVIQVVGWIFIPLGSITLAMGALRFNKVKQMIQKAETVTLYTVKSE